MPRVRQILFVAPGPIVWAQHLKLFEAHGVEVETTQTVSSDQIGQGLADGTWNVGIGVVDNILAWNLERQAGLRIMAQLERSQAMAFCAAPGCASLAQAAAGTIVVDSTTNGFVLVLYRALARAGIARASCRFEPVGGVRQRFEALVAGQVTSTILVPPFIDMALAKGCFKLWSGDAYAPDYPGVVAGARAGWLQSDRDAALAYGRALQQANAWAMDPAHYDEAVAALTAYGYAPLAAERLVQGAVPGLAPSRAGLEETVNLRREAGLSVGAPSEFEAVVDTALLRESRSAAKP
jgi:ABC-type nitrate/sulfonate/bicarbonate transport system substrate-binding protein